MSKKVLVVSSSFRRHGNSDLLCDEFVRGAQEAGNVVEKIFLKDYKINFCLGCGVCNSTHKCVQKDDMEALIAKMLEADVIVLATPVYFYAMSGQMKTFIDRTVPRYEEISGKDFYFILSAADTNKENMARVIEGFRGYTEDCLAGAKEKGIIYGVGAWQAGEIKSSPVMEEAYQMGKSV